MLDEDLDIGFYAEDAYAAYVAQVAAMLHIIPDFSNARGATVDVIFYGPFMTEAAFQEAALDLRKRDLISAATPSAEKCHCYNTSIWERLAQAPQTDASRTVVLHACIEKLNGSRKVQLTEPVQLLRKAKTDLDCSVGSAETHGEFESEDSGNGISKRDRVATTKHHRVLGSLDFFLHLFTRNPLLGDSNVSQDSLSMDMYGASPSDPTSVNHGDASAAGAIRNALEQRDDIAVARNAVRTVIKFARLAEEHPGKIATVYTDVKRGVDYLQFDS
ncbi:hypothetical protein ABL78_3634 [Leptomonas seymouri]|uniref:Uncharacterized protein n=1 Tax=Leptomonas seymouri TaxID=5684 RepID=A0A0N0P6L2_LEPSE|nr:hypothetical protein ABL78_3634 [Leptomonas seymouri]|eukprot:KPI87297.1 hypothetical protein ABL78_3634 [Leptomonas seymouri]